MSQSLPIDLLCAWARGTLPAEELEHCLFGDLESCLALPDTLVADIADLTASDESVRIDATGRVLERVGTLRPADDYWTVEMLSFPPPAVITALFGRTPDRVLEEPSWRRSGEGAIQLRVHDGDLFELRRTGTYPDVEIRLEDGRELKVVDIAINSFDFGKHLDRARWVRLSLTFSRAGFARATRMLIADESTYAREFLKDKYEGWLADPHRFYWEEWYQIELARLGFPGVDELLEHPGVLRKVVGLGGFNPYYYLDQLLPNNEDGFQYVINSVDGLEVKDAGVTLNCLCYVPL